MNEPYFTQQNFSPENLASAAYYGSDANIYRELSELAELVGIKIIALPFSQINTNISQPLRISRDKTQNTEQTEQYSAVLNFTNHNCADGMISAKFHPTFAPYFANGSVQLNLRNESAEILELMAAVGSTTRGQVLGIVGAQGGIGTSTTALWIARELAKKGNSVALIDLDPTSTGIDLIFSGANIPGKRWEDIRGSGAMLANRLTNALPKWAGVSVLSADSRGCVNPESGAGEKAIAALSQIHEWTILDLPTRTLNPADNTAKWLEWCDAILLLSGTNSTNLASTQARIERLPHTANLAIIAVGAKSRGHLAEISQQLGHSAIFRLRKQKNLTGDLEHGLTPGDKNRSVTSRDIRVICAALLENSDIPLDT